MADHDAEVRQHQWERRNDLLERIALSTLYHRRRERWFATYDRLVKAVAIIGGSAAVARVTDEHFVQITAAAIAVTSTAALVFGLADKARLHADLATRYCRLESDVRADGLAPGDVELARWEAATAEIEAVEPPALAALVRLCQNDIAWSRGQPHRVYRLRWYERLLANWIDWPTRRLDPIGR